MDYYVYVYLDIRKPGVYQYGSYVFEYQPFYVGKGTAGRYKQHLSEAKNNHITDRSRNLHKCNIINKIRRELINDPVVVFPHENLSPNDAIALEIELIGLIGRYNTSEGPLTNITKGGQGGCGSHSKETKQKMSEAHLGREFSEETKQRMSYSHHRRTDWIVVDPTGEEIQTSSLSKFCIDNELDYRAMLKVSQRTEQNKHVFRAKRHKGYTCRKAV